MANPAQLIISSAPFVEAGANLTVAASVSGVLSTLNSSPWTPQNLVNCQINLADQSVRKHVSTYAWDAGCTSVETIASGEGAFLFVANTDPAFPGYPTFGGRVFMAGLTSESTINNYVDIDYAIQIWQGGVVIWENGVLRRTARAPRNNGVYLIGIENGQVVYRADGEIIYRSGVPFAYPLRVGVAFYHGDTYDHIGGNPLTPITYTAFNASGAASGSWASNVWTAPAMRGKYTLRGRTANNVIGETTVDVLKRFPQVNDPATGLPCPTRWWQLPPEWPVIEQVFDDQSADYNMPYDKVTRRWRIEYSSKLKQAQAAILDNFYAEHRGSGYPFYFYDPRDGVLYDNVRFVKDRYTRDHRQIWRQSRTIELVRRPL